MTDRKTPSDLRRAADAARRAATGAGQERTPSKPAAAGSEPMGVRAVGTPGPTITDLGELARWVQPRTPPEAAAPRALEPELTSVRNMGVIPGLQRPRAPLLGGVRLPPRAPKATLARIPVGPAVRTQDILDAWLGDVSDDSVLTPEGPEAARWFGTDLHLEQDIATRFTADLKAAAAAGPRDTGPHQTLAHIILLDPIARRIHRDSPEMYATDALARGYCLHALRNKHHRALGLAERLMLGLPLLHAERPALQDASVRYFEHLCLLASERRIQDVV